MARFIIRGGRPIQGRFRPAGNKNAVLPMLAACILTEEPVLLHHVPLIEDVHTMLDLLDHLGAEVDLHGHTVRVYARRLRTHRLHPDLCRRARSTVLFAGPIAARFGRVTLFPPGGDVIGRRRLDTHLEGLRALGIHVAGQHTYEFRRHEFRGARLVLDEASVTATENLLMAAVLAPGRTVLYNAACEPHVQDLCRMLRKMGARISGAGTNCLRIEGVTSLGGTRHRVGSDHIEAASYLAAAALTGGELVVEDAPVEALEVIARGFARLNVFWTREGRTIHLPAGQTLRVRNDFGAAIPKLEDGPWPNFPSDLMSVMLVLATQAHGTLLCFEKMFESRLYFVDRLIAMGARLVQCDPHRVVVSGPSRLHATHVTSPDIRAGIAMVLAALCAHGESVIENAQMVDRGYERVDAHLQRLGAHIVRQDDAP